ncbi:DUF2235 domain-containing protein [Vibrio ponticus]|uniref:DUF2235 domain-containing protein n=1 Tax=Vibrio ponticus TaxID=265668 RepID=A0A3N3DZ12_9VIBR|nr:DUF2235 domain-containing protein [Vibrio ponticus]ROV59754.1 DUF2235 domain-containing protein [Vibrio ponticus]
MSLIGVNAHCVPCEKNDHWIEIIIRDEHNQPFNNISGTLIDGCGKKYSIVVGESPIVLTDLSPGRVIIELDEKDWKESTERCIPYKGNNSPAKLWFNANPNGYQDCKREWHNHTVGDFLSDEQNLSVPSRHKKGKLNSLKLVTDSSHFVVIQGMTFIALRLGVFFDGTANNSYSAKWGKQHLDDNYGKWKAAYETSKEIALKSGKSLDDISAVDFIDSCFDFPDIEGSATNELTNVQKLYDLYISNEYNDLERLYYHSQYITGIGTGNSTEIAMADEDSFSGMARGVGDYGVEQKVITAVEQICRELDRIVREVEEVNSVIDGFKSLEFDVFGFSRGSAAARHFINTVLDGETGVFGLCFNEKLAQLGLSLPSAFNWDKPTSCQVTFAGLFDTVAAIADFSNFDFSVHNSENDPVRLWLDPKRVNKAIHLVANKTTEYRKNFSLNRLNKAGNFEEIIVPGAHSDIGGGYHSRMVFNESDYMLPLLENKLVRRHSIITKRTGRRVNRRIKRLLVERLKRKLEREVKQGWSKKDYIITKPKVRYLNHDRQRVSMRLIYRRVTNGELSRLYLRIMYGLAEFSGVPLVDIKDNQSVWMSESGYFGQYFSVPAMINDKFEINGQSFGEFCLEMLNSAKEGNSSKIRTRLCSHDIQRKFFELGLIHHSSDEAVTAGFIKANKPNRGNDKYEREEYSSKKSS